MHSHRMRRRGILEIMRVASQSGSSFGVALTARQQATLTAIVEQYVATGEPVASQGIAVASGMSSATVRNTMAELVEAGYLEQPHTSAGRVPTARAFRLHVEQLQGGNRIATALLPLQSRSQIDASLQGVSGADAFLERTSQVLSVLSSSVGVAMATAREGDVLEHVHFQRLGARRVLAVMVSRGGVVRDRVLQMDQDVLGEELDAASRYLNEHFRGWTIDGVRAEIARRAETERGTYQRMRQAAEELWTAAMLDAAQVQQTVFVDGVSNLIGDGYDGTRLREMLAALQTKERVIALLHAYLGTDAMLHHTGMQPARVRVVFDMEVHAPEMQGLVLIAAPAMSDGTQHGAVGVIGTQRMHYENMINAVHYVAQLFASSQAGL